MEEYLSLNQTQNPKKVEKMELSIAKDEKTKELHTQDTEKRQDMLDELRKKMAVNQKLHPLYSKEEMGRLGWTVLHLFSAFYPVNPTEEDKVDMKNFLKGFAKFYPCKECGGHFAEMLGENPLQADNRAEMMDYFCRLHNNVNTRLSKPEMPCELVGKVWGQKDCGCNVQSILQDNEKDNEILQRKIELNQKIAE